MQSPAYKFVFLHGALEVRVAGDVENHYALVYEMANDLGLDIEAIEPLGGGILYPHKGELIVSFFPRVEDDEELRVALEDALQSWAAEHGHRLSYSPGSETWDLLLDPA